VVGERPPYCEVHDVSRDGEWRSENVGTSNRNAGEIPARRKPKVSLAMVIIQGLVGPKPMAKAGGDGQLVNIPALRIFLMTGRNLVHRSCYWIRVHSVRIEYRKIRTLASVRHPSALKMLIAISVNSMEQVSKKSV